MNRPLPALASWLLEQFHIPQRNEPFLGDLIEEYSGGRSKSWLWRQVLCMLWTTLLADAKRDIWGHKLLSIRAIVVGLFVVIPFRVAREQTALHGVGDDAIEFWLFNFAAFALAGWVIAHTHRQCKRSMVIAFLAYASIAKIWPGVTHFQHIWSLARPYEILVDISLTAASFLLCLLASLAPAPASIQDRS